MGLMHIVLGVTFLIPPNATITGSASVLTRYGLTPDAYAIILILVGMVLHFAKVPNKYAPILFLPLFAYVVPAIDWVIQGQGVRPGYPVGLALGMTIGVTALHFASIVHARHCEVIAEYEAALKTLKEGRL